MKVIEVVNQEAIFSFSYKEVLFLNAAINEVCHAILVPEFDIRMGASKEEAEFILKKLMSVIDNYKIV